jgi:hypothetical protein
MKKYARSILDRLLHGRPRPASSVSHKRGWGIATIAVLALALFIVVPTAFLSGGTAQKGAGATQGGQTAGFTPSFSQAISVTETPAVRDLRPVAPTPEQIRKVEEERRESEKNVNNPKRVKTQVDAGKRGVVSTDAAINNYKHTGAGINAVTNPIQNFDGPDMDIGAGLFGGRFAPPDTNAAVGPNHVVITTNGGVQIFNKTGTSLVAQFRLSTLLAGIPNAGDDDGDPVVVYDSLADRWVLSQFNITFDANNKMHEHIAVSKTSDPTGAYWAYDFALTAGRFGDYPHMGVWPDGYYWSTNDFNAAGTAFLGAGLYVVERNKMIVGDPTAKLIAFNTGNTHGGMLPTNLQGYTPPPVGTPNLFIEFDADEFGAATDLIRPFSFHVDYATPANSTLTQLADIPTAAFDARTPSGRTHIQQPGGGEALDSIADRLMHALNFRVLAGGVQSYVLNFTVNVSGVTPTSAATYQAGVRWMELRRNSGTGVVTINQQATYAPGSGNPTGRDLWMAAVAQDGEGNIGLAASATNSTATPATLNPTAIYTGRLPGDPANTLPQGEVDAMSAVTRGVQTATSSRWGDYSSLFVDPADECTFWGAFEYVDSPTASFDWNTRIFSFKVNPSCATAARGTININVTNCTGGAPIANAVITTPEGFSRQTNGSGAASMIVTPGTYTVTVTAPNFDICTQTVTVTNGGTATVTCCLNGAASIVGAGATLVSESCVPANGVVDPGETVTVSLCVQNTGGGNTTNLVGTLQATGGVTSPSAAQSYGVVTTGGPTVCRDFTFTASGTCGGTVTASLALQDGVANLGTVTYSFSLGVLNTALTQNFDGVTAPALPAGWTTSFTNGAANCTPTGTCALGGNWVTATTNTPPSAANAAFHNNPTCVTDGFLVSPPINITTATAQLTFRNAFNLESTFDGAVLEVSSPNINAGAFTDITNAAVGGSFVSGGYTGTISVNFLSPIPGRQAWTGLSGGSSAAPTYLTTVANLGPNVAGQTITLRWRLASDCSLAASGTSGQWIDNISIADGYTCCGMVSCTVTCPANITTSNDPNQCGKVVSYPAPTTTGTCGTVTCTPPSGSFFPKGTTTVTCTSSGGGARAAAAPSGACQTPTTITHSSSQAIISLNSVSCNSISGHTDNSYWRAFSLPAFGISGAFNVESVDIGIEEATAGGAGRGASKKSISKNQRKAAKTQAPSGGPSQPITVRIYQSSSAFPTGFPGSLTLLNTFNGSINDQSLTILNVPITGAVTAGGELVVEVFTPSGESAGNFFFIGSNAAGETGPSYISAADCGITSPTTTSAIGFPDMQIVMNVHGCPQGGGTGPSCSFTVTVNDTQPPSITCPTNVAAVAAPACPAPTATTVTYTTPTATDNCPGVTVACVPPSGGTFPVGTTTVTCTATDTSSNTATCSFSVKVFNVCIQDRFNANAVLAWNTVTGDYVFCCNGTTFTGVGKVANAGCVYTLNHTPPNLRITGSVNFANFTGFGSLQSPPGTTKCSISDNDVRNNNCACVGGIVMPSAASK